MFNHHDITRDAVQLDGKLASCGYDWWWHSFTGHDARTGEEKSFFIEFFLCNPALGGEKPILGQHPSARREKRRPSYLMVKCGAWGPGAAQLHRLGAAEAAHPGQDGIVGIKGKHRHGALTSAQFT